MDTGKIILSLVGGLLVGAALGVLFAPAKGSATRRKIASKGEDLTHDLDEKFHDMLKMFKKQFESMKAEAAQQGENGKAKSEKAAAEAASVVK